ncbi:hypothetical protein ACLB2K_001252 [Fragaria x ananassa]
MAAQFAHTALKLAEDDLGKLIKSVERLIRHKHHFTQELNTIKSRLNELQPVVKNLKLTIESFKFRLTVKEVGDFQQKLKEHMQLCANFSGESNSLKDSRYTKQLDELDKSLKEQLHILTGQKSNSHEGNGVAVVLGGVKGRVETLIHNVLEPLIHTNRPDEHNAKALFDHLYGCVHTLMNNKVHFKIELGNIKSRLDGLKPLQVNYIERIEDCNESLHFSIKEVDDYKKELSKAIKLCEDFSREENSLQKSAFTNRLYQLNRDLKKQMENLTAKKRKAGILSLRPW